jgi:hypothetical protein
MYVLKNEINRIKNYWCKISKNSGFYKSIKNLIVITSTNGLVNVNILKEKKNINLVFMDYVISILENVQFSSVDKNVRQ